MSKAQITEQYLTDIAGAIRSHFGTETRYKPSQMADAIRSIPKTTEYHGLVEVTQNGNADIVQDGLTIQLSTLLTWNNTAIIQS